MRTAFALILLLSSCASSTIYLDGKRVAELQGDLKGLTYTRKPDGSATISIASLNHSEATRAQGEAGAGKIASASSMTSAVAGYLIGN